MKTYMVPEIQFFIDEIAVLTSSHPPLPDDRLEAAPKMAFPPTRRSVDLRPLLRAVEHFRATKLFLRSTSIRWQGENAWHDGATPLPGSFVLTPGEFSPSEKRQRRAGTTARRRLTEAFRTSASHVTVSLQLSSNLR